MRALAARDLRYLGLIGSRAKVARIFDALADEGLPAECLAHVRAPIGLAIGAVTPAEIAISILAEMIAVHRGADANVTSMPSVNVERRRHKTEQS
jgi:xanthine dehydrogenase accessory factor